MKKVFVLFLSVLAVAESANSATICRDAKFGLETNVQEVCAIIDAQDPSTLHLITDVAAGDSFFEVGVTTRQAKGVCELFGFKGRSVFVGTIRKTSQAGFIGGGEIVAANNDFVRAINTVHCKP